MVSPISSRPWVPWGTAKVLWWSERSGSQRWLRADLRSRSAHSVSTGRPGMTCTWQVRGHRKWCQRRGWHSNWCVMTTCLNSVIHWRRKKNYQWFAMVALQSLKLTCSPPPLLSSSWVDTSLIDSCEERRTIALLFQYWVTICWLVSTILTIGILSHWVDTIGQQAAEHTLTLLYASSITDVHVTVPMDHPLLFNLPECFIPLPPSPPLPTSILHPPWIHNQSPRRCMRRVSRIEQASTSRMLKRGGYG